MDSSISFLGKGWGFPPVFRRKMMSVEMVTEEDAVFRSIKIILSTNTGERIMSPAFGVNMQPYYFSSMNVQNRAMIEKIVKESLIINEPRIVVEDVITTPLQDKGIMNIEIKYTIRSTNTRYNYVYPFYINEATDMT